MKMRPKDLRKRLMVKFRSEEGLDYGGVARYVILNENCDDGVKGWIFCSNL